MSEPFYVVSSTVRKVEGVHRRVTLPTGHEAEIGVHGPVKEHYRIDADDLPLPVDYMVGTTGG